MHIRAYSSGWRTNYARFAVLCQIFFQVITSLHENIEVTHPSFTIIIPISFLINVLDRNTIQQCNCFFFFFLMHSWVFYWYLKTKWSFNFAYWAPMDVSLCICSFLIWSWVSSLNHWFSFLSYNDFISNKNSLKTTFKFWVIWALR